jgi:hypothetical protein
MGTCQGDRRLHVSRKRFTGFHLRKTHSRHNAPESFALGCPRYETGEVCRPYAVILQKNAAEFARDVFGVVGGIVFDFHFDVYIGACHGNRLVRIVSKKRRMMKTTVPL